MDLTTLLVQLLPASALPYLKTVAAIVGGCATVVVNQVPAVSGNHYWVWLTLVLTALGVYHLPNVRPVAGVPVEKNYQAESEFPRPDDPVVLSQVAADKAAEYAEAADALAKAVEVTPAPAPSASPPEPPPVAHVGV